MLASQRKLHWLKGRLSCIQRLQLKNFKPLPPVKVLPQVDLSNAHPRLEKTIGV
ncbi:hypothetical protein M23134_05040 [Microscilla marina ATCC 23134]|uniref:Uncharacterized protein n=1 Tax=Microscilla marina ATCC 23134 TaxID=313606 RepID=A1ZCZ5_MICM2|nr:hypothetical protein M23134_05040 [Microscilla marina ATCC 23134]